MPENPEKKFVINDVMSFNAQESFISFSVINNRYFVVTNKRIVEITSIDGNK